ncbi:MAG: hypothetical protein H0W69_10985 [Gemmatimonadaceae bacterium]|nr:hypothetical protein [Gemmatimonadaceae bacterium]
MRITTRFAIMLAVAGTFTGSAALTQDSASGKKPKRVPLFESTQPLEITLTVNLKQIQRDKGDSVPWRAATLATIGADGNPVTLPIKVRTRGIWRLKKCEFPPIRLNFAKAAVKGTAFQGLDKPKLVTFCRDAGLHEQYIVQEFQLYRIYQLITPLSHHVRLLRLSYVDSASGKLVAKRFAFLLEEPEAMAERLDGIIVKEKGARAEDLDDAAVALFGMFEFMIGNTDFSISALHNAELLSRPVGPVVPVAYDFDFSGAVNTTYATPEPKLQLENVRTRRYRAYCVDASHVGAAVAQFNAKRMEIFALYEDQIGKLINPRLKDSALEYFNDFYRIINDRGSLRSQVIESCLPRDKSDAPSR